MPSRKNERDMADPLALARRLASVYDPTVDGLEREYSRNREEGKNAAALTAAGRTRDLAEKFIRYAPESYHAALWEAYAYSLSSDKLGIAKALQLLAQQVQEARQCSIEQGFPVPNPQSFGEPAPKGVLTEKELILLKVSHGRATD